ncbi:hypothetical protein VP01_1100g5 [Puccinia sorghi]|uniref:Uncharacterized protein n=1 Tax=Puccinia sorghi TaxID=27349 RepID=A0A0L6VSU7_9BASI|nr:hypothetical protein VP01_1100g5 [Puccinia sorghi]
MRKLINFLNCIRRAYLVPSSSGSIGQFSSTRSHECTVDLAIVFYGFSNVRWLSEREKDQIDTLVAVGFKKPVQDVRALEAVEKYKQTLKLKQPPFPL